MGNETSPFDFVAYFTGEQPFWRAAITSAIGCSLASALFLGISLETLGVSQNEAMYWYGSEIDYWRNTLYAVLDYWAIVIIVALGLAVWTLWACSSNISKIWLRVFSWLCISAVTAAWVALGVSFTRIVLLR